MNPKRLQRLLRLVTFSFVGLGSLYLWNRYELFDLPVDGCSPLRRIRPGNSLWVDRWPSDIEVGDVLFFELAGGGIALAEVERSEDEPARYWLASDDESCPGRDSSQLGWIPREAVHGRLIMAFDL